jgi:cell division transport system permease protein
MKLVGATNWFIRVPFMLEGVIQGMAGAVVAILLLVATRPLYTNLLKSFKFLNLTVTYGEIVLNSAWVLAFGILIGAIGSLLGLRRFLDV